MHVCTVFNPDLSCNFYTLTLKTLLMRLSSKYDILQRGKRNKRIPIPQEVLLLLKAHSKKRSIAPCMVEIPRDNNSKLVQPSVSEGKLVQPSVSEGKS